MSAKPISLLKQKQFWLFSLKNMRSSLRCIANWKKKNRQLSGGMKRRVGLIQALLHNPSVLIVDEPTTGLDPEERIRIRNLLFDFSADRTVLFSTHVTEDLAATCNQLAVMKKGHFLYSGNMSELIEQAQGHVWKCRVSNENKAREVEQRYHVSAKQLTSDGLLMKIISSSHPDIECWPCEASLEDAYIYLSNIKTWCYAGRRQRKKPSYSSPFDTPIRPAAALSYQGRRFPLFGAGSAVHGGSRHADIPCFSKA